MKNSSFATKCLLLAVTLGVLAYFGIQGLQYFSDPLTTTLAYNYQVEEGMDLSGYVVRQEQVLADEPRGLLRLRRSEGKRSAPAARWLWCTRTRPLWTGSRRSRS